MNKLPIIALVLTATMAGPALAGGVTVQCPGDPDGDGVSSITGVKCKHLAASDGQVTMADGYPQYIFSYSDVTGTPLAEVVGAGQLRGVFPAPTVTLDEGDEFYLTLTNVGFIKRPDLIDPHTVHWHGFPQAAAVFDGVPEASIGVKPFSSFTYYYKVNEPGTFMYHCHMEATEHMQMGMLGNLYVRPRQDKTAPGTPLNDQPGAYVHQAGDRYAYNDGDGSTRYDVDYPIQLGSFDPDFHDASADVQPLPFAMMKDKYPLINGRGYPDTINPAVLTFTHEELGNATAPAQPMPALIKAKKGQRVLLRLSNLNVTTFHTVSTMGIPMLVVGRGAKILRGGGVPEGKSLFYKTNSVTLGGGESTDVILDTADLTPGTYFFYTTNLNYLSNNNEDFGGMMTEVVIEP